MCADELCTRSRYGRLYGSGIWSCCLCATAKLGKRLICRVHSLRSSARPRSPHLSSSLPPTPSSTTTKWLLESTPTPPCPHQRCTPHMPSHSQSRTSSQACKTRTGATTRRCVLPPQRSLPSCVRDISCFRMVMQEDAECPLCLEEMDISDLNFKPCPCGYQVRASAGPSSLELPSLTRGAALCRSASSAGTTSRRTSTADALRAGGSTLMRPSSSSRSTQRSECLVVCSCHSVCVLHSW